LALLDLFAGVFKQANEGQEYILDSFPVPVCDNIRISRGFTRARIIGAISPARSGTSMVCEYIWW